MRAIKSRDTRPELVLRQNLFALGFRYRVHARLPGKPDIVFRNRKVAVFVDGCFWHSCPEHLAIPKTNRDKWLAKLEANAKRDLFVTSKLEADGWAVVRIWEHEVKRNLDCALKKVVGALHGEQNIG